MSRSGIVLASVIFLGACGASTITKAPAAASSVACRATQAAATSASSVMFATTGKYPTSFAAMTVGASAPLKPGQGTSVAGNTITGPGWKLTMSGGGATAPTFKCVTVPFGS